MKVMSGNASKKLQELKDKMERQVGWIKVSVRQSFKSETTTICPPFINHFVMCRVKSWKMPSRQVLLNSMKYL